MSLTFEQLFNASAVIESRASTRLGENVKVQSLSNLLDFHD